MLIELEGAASFAEPANYFPVTVGFQFVLELGVGGWDSMVVIYFCMAVFHTVGLWCVHVLNLWKIWFPKAWQICHSHRNLCWSPPESVPSAYRWLRQVGFQLFERGTGTAKSLLVRTALDEVSLWFASHWLYPSQILQYHFF